MGENKNFMEALASDIKDKKSGSKIEEVNEVEEIAYESSDDKPASFHTETFTRIEKKKIEFSPKLIGGIIAFIILALLGIYFLFFAPNIEMQDFVGKKADEFYSWASQYQIDKKGIAINHEYNFEHDKDYVISQSISAGKKIRKDTKLTIVLSDGPNPDEKVSFPDIKNMTYDELKNWIDTNKLLKTKITTEYSTTVAENAVISFDLKSVNENNFTRGTTLNIVVSKGVAPAGQVTVEDFTGKTFEEMKTWANNKKVVLERQDSYSDTVAIDKIISQSIKSGEAMKTGEKIIAVVSKGKAVKIPNLVGYTKAMLDTWIATPDNKVSVVKKEVYNEAPYGNVIAQSIAAGSAVDQGSVLELTISLYRPVLQTNSRAWETKNYMELIAWVDDANYKGANIAAGAWAPREYHPTIQEDSIIRYVCADGNGNQLPGGANGCERPLPLDAKINIVVSKGPEPTAPVVTVEKATLVNENDIFIGDTSFQVKSGANTDVIVKDTNGNDLASAKTNELGFATLTTPNGLPDYIVVITKIGSQTERADFTIKIKPTPTPTTP
ncbi:MAG: PASTA domain-containing protein [Erysipelotrichaceae bacterium]|nr:PASTA domain-containing protein [Erysipelotrichaceae bacterium]